MFSKTEAWSNITKNGDNIVIVSHPSPDGDAIGSCYALALALELLDKKPVVILDNFNSKYDFLQGKKFLYTGDISKLKCDVFICVDCGDKKRIGEAESIFNNTPITINIDHHINNGNFARFNYIDTAASSTCEVIFDIINMAIPVNKNIAEALYTGIVTDTGGFRYSSTSPQTMETVARLMRTGIDFTSIQYHSLYSRSKVEVEVFALALSNIEYVQGYPIAYTTLKQSEMEKIGANHSDLDGIVEHVLNIKGIEIGAFFYERQVGYTKVSLRSKDIAINGVAQSFGGGGHKFAAAANFKADFEQGCSQVINSLKDLLKNGRNS